MFVLISSTTLCDTFLILRRTERDWSKTYIGLHVRGGAATNYFLMSYDGIDSVVGKSCLFMYRIASLLLLQRLKGSKSGEARGFNNIETRAVIKFFFLQGKASKEIHAILTETLGEHAPAYVTDKNWVAQFKHGDFSTCHTPRPGRPKRVTTPEIID